MIPLEDDDDEDEDDEDVENDEDDEDDGDDKEDEDDKDDEELIKAKGLYEQQFIQSHKSFNHTSPKTISVLQLNQFWKHLPSIVLIQQSIM